MALSPAKDSGLLRLAPMQITQSKHPLLVRNDMEYARYHLSDNRQRSNNDPPALGILRYVTKYRKREDKDNKHN